MIKGFGEIHELCFVNRQNHEIMLDYRKCNFPHEPLCPTVYWSVGLSVVGCSVCHDSLKGRQLHLHAPIGTLLISWWQVRLVMLLADC